MAVPPILYQFTAADVQRYLRTVAAAPSANLTPTEGINTVILPDRAVNAISSNHLNRQPGTAGRVQITEYGTTFPLWGLRIHQGQRQGGYACPNVGAWSFNGSHACLMVLRLDAEGLGGPFIGPIKGPNKNNPHSGDTFNTYGTDRGWFISSNGGGLYGLACYGDEGGGDQNARAWRPNVDMTIGTTSCVGRGFRILIYGYDPNYGGAGVAGGYLWSADPTQRPFETFAVDGVSVGNAGNVACPDGRMTFGACEYESNSTTTADQFVTYFEGVLACAWLFTGAAGDSIHANKTAICAAVQATL